MEFLSRYHQQAWVHELQRRLALREALRRAYEAVPGDPRFCVRRREVVEHVAGVLGESVINNAFCLKVEAAARELGWQRVKNGGRALYRCVKQRKADVAAALAESKANRHDPRTWRGRTLGAADANHP